MKKRFLLFVVLSAVLVLLVSCSEAGSSNGGNSNGGNSNGGKTVTYTVTFDSGGGSDVPSQNVQPGGTADRPPNPVQKEHSFVDWYSDAQFQTVYNFDQPVTEDTTLYAVWHHELKSVIENGTVPVFLDTYGLLIQAVFTLYAADAAIVAKYVDVTAQGDGDASSWEHAAGDIRATVNGITGADADTIYLVLLASGTHIPTDTLAMKNNVAILGGWNRWEQIGTSTINGGKTRRVFSNDDIDHTALLYGVTIADGNTANDGGGMYNLNRASPTLINVMFVNNEASKGGGMANADSSSPTLLNVAFVNNEAGKGGGMYNISSLSTLLNVTFANNEAIDGGGGIYNYESSFILINVTFANNRVTNGNGGGIASLWNLVDFPDTLSNVTFVNNKASSDGGGMYHDSNGGSSPTIVNTLFWNNAGGASAATAGQQIYLSNAGSGAENMSIFFSLVQHEIVATTSATADTDSTDGLGIGGGTELVTVTEANNISGNPKLAADLADNGGPVQTIALLKNSAAANAGAYVLRSGAAGSFTFYYSKNYQLWYSNADFSGSVSAPPADALDLTAADARGYARNGRPDIGAYEYGGTAP